LVAGALNLFEHVAQLNKHRVRDPPTEKLLQCGNCCTCTEQKQIQVSVLVMQCALQSMRKLSLIVVRKHRYSILDNAQIKSSSTVSPLLDFVFLLLVCLKMSAVTA